jgi:hypothetical protein
VKFGSVLLGTALLGASGAELLGLLEAVTFGVDVDDLGAVDEAVDEGDDAGGVREDLAPRRERLVGAEQDGALGVVTAGDDLEEEVRVAAVVREVADLVQLCGAPHNWTHVEHLFMWSVADGDRGSHYQRYHRYPGTHPLASRRGSAMPPAYGRSARRWRQFRDTGVPPR